MNKILGLTIIFCLLFVNIGIGYSAVTGVNTAVSTTIATDQKTITSTATVIVASNSIRKSILIRNIGAVDIYIGTSAVTTATGFLLKANESIGLDRNTAAIYGRTASTSGTVAYIEE
jgi:hypothetical protein